MQAAAIAAALASLSVSLGVFASLGNHDWSDCAEARQNGHIRSSIERAYERVGIQVLCNENTLFKNGNYLAELDSMIGTGTTFRPQARHDPRAAFAGIPENASMLLLAHEPDFFLGERHLVALQVSGHTHGGQIGAPGIWAQAGRRAKPGGRRGHWFWRASGSDWQNQRNCSN